MEEVFKDKLRVIANDEFMLKALEMVALEKIEKNKPQINNIDNDNVLGQKYRASKEAENIIKNVLLEISSYKEKSKNILIHKEK